MEDFFVSVERDFDVKKINNRVEPIMHTQVDYDFVILTSTYLSEEEIAKLIGKCRRELGKTIKAKVVFTFNLFEEKANINLDYFQKNTIDLTQYINPYSKVLVVGKALYAITKSKDLHIGKGFNLNGFYDIVFNESNFYSPLLKSQIFPVPELDDWLGKDNFEKFFSLMQISELDKFEVEKTRVKRLQVSEVTNIHAFYNAYEGEEFIAIDTETSGLDFTTDRIGCVTVAFNDTKGFYIDWDLIEQDKKAFEDFIKPKYQIYANGKFDIKMLMHHNIDRESLHIESDIVALSHIVNELQRNSLKASAWLFTPYGGYDDALVVYKEEHNIESYLDIPKEILMDYAVKDAIITFMIHKKLYSLMKKIDTEFPMTNDWSLERYYDDIRIPAINTFIDIEYKGMFVDKAKIVEAENIITVKVNKAKEKIYEAFMITEDVLDLNSPTQLAKFFKGLGWENIGVGKSGQYLTGDKPLNKWAKLGHPEALLILDYRKQTTLLKTFIGREKEGSGFYKHLKKWDDDYKLHSNFFVMLANSHRGRSSAINMQNLPKHGEGAKLIRAYFKPPSDDYYVGEWDASGLQLRIHAILSGDRQMRDAFLNHGGDLHSVTAQSLFRRDVTIEEFLKRKHEKGFKEARFKAKGANFSLIFGTSAFSFAKETLEGEWSKQECIDYIAKNGLERKRANLTKMVSETGQNKDSFTASENSEFSYYWVVASDLKKKFFELYPDSANYIEKRIAFACKNGYVRNPFGIIRRLPNLLYEGKDSKGLKTAKNKALNSPVQGYEAVLMMKAITGIEADLKLEKHKSTTCGNVHDSGVMYIHKDEVDTVKGLVKKHFECDIPENKGIPMETELEISDYSKGEYWGFGREV